MVEDGSGMEGSSGRRMISGRSNVVKADLEKVRCDGGSALDSESCGLLGKNSR